MLAELPPPGDWPKPPPIRAVDASIYELHIRDFSIGDTTVPPEHRGTYLAFTHDSAGMRHLRALAEAGLTRCTCCPATTSRRSRRIVLASSTPGRSTTCRPTPTSSSAAIGEVRERDGFNWGYDPLHYLAPEGSYAVEDRTREFRAMVRALQRHRPAGRARRRLQPHARRLAPGPSSSPATTTGSTPTGEIYDSTCCANTATEHRMMEKLMLDALEHWARQYRVDGFRFDLMGHHTKANLLAARERLGPELHLYGEGWSFGEVADDALFVAASQRNMAGTGIGTFNDSLRDAVRGGGPHDADPTVQGWATGNPWAQERVQLGLAGQLQPGGYAARPDDAIAYVDAHDNETLFDALALKLPRETSMDDRVRLNTVALATVTLSSEPVLLARGRRPAALEVAGPQLLRLRRLVQPDRLDGHARARGAPACRPRGTTRSAGRSCARCSPTRRSSRSRTTSRPRANARWSCCGSATRRRSSGSATRSRSAATCASSPARRA